MAAMAIDGETFVCMGPTLTDVLHVALRKSTVKYLFSRSGSAASSLHHLQRPTLNLIDQRAPTTWATMILYWVHLADPRLLGTLTDFMGRIHDSTN
jgi:hypothetical protein